MTPERAPPRPLPDRLTTSERVLLNGSLFARPRQPRTVWRFMFFMGIFLVAVGIALGSMPFWFPDAGSDLHPLASVALAIGVQIVPGVLMAYFGRPTKDRTETAPALDNEECVDIEELVTALIGAAILTREADGAIRLEVVDDEEQKLLVHRENTDIEYPAATLEARLTARDATPFDDLVHDWLSSNHATPWRRALTQIDVMAAIRGLLTARGLGDAGFDLAHPNARLESQQAEALIETARSERSNLWALIERGVRSAAQRRTVNAHSDNYSPTDPWMDEARADREQFAAGSAVSFNEQAQQQFLGMLGFGGALWFGVVMAAFYPNAGYAVEIWIVVALLLVAVAHHPSRPFEWFTTRAWDLYERGAPNTTLAPRGKYVLGLVVGTPLLILAGGLGSMYPLVGGAILLLVGSSLLLKQFKRKALGALEDAVVGDTSPASDEDITPTETVDQRMPQTSKQPVLATVDEPDHGRPPVSLPFELDVLQSDSLPPISAASQKRIDAVTAHRLFPLFAISTVLLGVSVTGVIYRATRHVFGFSGSFGIAVGLMFFTVILVGSATYSSRLLAKAKKLAENDPLMDKEMRSFLNAFTPERGLRNFSLFWVLLAIFGPEPFSPEHYVCLAIVGLWWIVVTWPVNAFKRRHEQRWVRRELLALRVFDSPYLDEFLDLSDLWRWMGPIQRLHGPDTATADVHMVTSYLTGRVRTHVVDTIAKLEQAIHTLRRAPDLAMRYPINSLQCSEDVWREAVRILVDESAVVVVDLSNLSAENRAVAWEVGLLANRMPFSHTVLLIHDSTDMDVFRQVLAEAVANISPDSPNANAATKGPIIIHMGGSTERLEDESLHDWRQRMQERVNGKQLVGVLLDAARS